jgi:hypothetical protein
VQWTVEARYREFQIFVRSGTEAARRAFYLREADLRLHDRTIRAFLVPVGRNSHRKRNLLVTNKQKKARAAKAARKRNARAEQGARVSAERLLAEDDEMTVEQALDDTRPLDGYRVFYHPSRRITYREIIPACMLLFSLAIGLLLPGRLFLAGKIELLAGKRGKIVRVGLNTDFTKSKGFSCMGSVVQSLRTCWSS